MLFIFLVILSTVSAFEGISLCLPNAIVEWEEPLLEHHVHQCLVDNFNWKANNKTIILPFVTSYIKAYQKRQVANYKDNELFYKKRTLIVALRDTQLKVTHHIHAIEACASNRMPTMFMDAYSNEANMMNTVTDMWTHHIKQDLKQCHKLLLDIIQRQQLNLRAHLHHSLLKYTKAKEETEEARAVQLYVEKQVEITRHQLVKALT